MTLPGSPATPHPPGGASTTSDPSWTQRRRPAIHVVRTLRSSYSIWTAEPGSVGLPGGRTLLEGAVSTLRSELVGLSTFLTLSPVPGLRDSLEGRSDRAEWGGEAVEPTAVERAAVEFLTTLDDHGRPIDPVARFHLGNGARLLAVHADADRSDAGRRRSWGLMANYRYEPEDRAANRRALADGRVAVGPDLGR